MPPLFLFLIFAKDIYAPTRYNTNTTDNRVNDEDISRFVHVPSAAQIPLAHQR